MRASLQCAVGASHCPALLTKNVYMLHVRKYEIRRLFSLRVLLDFKVGNERVMCNLMFKLFTNFVVFACDGLFHNSYCLRGGGHFYAPWLELPLFVTL